MPRTDLPAVAPARRLLFVGVALLTAALAGCSSAASGAAGTTSGAESSSATTSTSATSKATSSSQTTSAVGRPVSFHQSVSWSDGLKVSITKITTSIIRPHDKGGTVGGDKSVFLIKLSNGRTRTYDSSGVTASVTYGSHHTAAARVIGEAGTSHQKFPASVATHHSATARFAFAIPKSERGSVTLTIRPTDHDVRPSAVFTGSTL